MEFVNMNLLNLEKSDRCEFVYQFAKEYWDNQGGAAESIKYNCSMQETVKDVKTIGTYYSRIWGGGAQKVVALLANLWSEMGYSVVLFTDEFPNEKDYFIRKEVIREVLPSSVLSTKDNYSKRGKELTDKILKYNIDVMVYHDWQGRCLLWDMLLCKMLGSRFAVYCHGIFMEVVKKGYRRFDEITKIFGLCDVLITLNEMDSYFWKNYNAKVYQMINPIDIHLEKMKLSDLESSNIIWIGRFSKEKRPLDALYIMRKVVESVPGAKLYMFGTIAKEDVEYYQNKIEELQLVDHVVLCGYLQDLGSYFGNAAVQLITSEQESFSLTLLEGLARGIPCVMYQLPYLVLTQSKKGIVEVEKGAIGQAAGEIILILQDAARRKALGQEANEHAALFLKHDIQHDWREVFDLSWCQMGESKETINKVTWDTFIDFCQRNEQNNKSKLGAGEKFVLVELLSRDIVLFGAGRRATWLLSTYPHLKIVCCIDNNVEKAGGKIRNVDIVHTDSISDWKKYFVIITVANNLIITKQLENKGLIRGKDFAYLTDLFEI